MIYRGRIQKVLPIQSGESSNGNKWEKQSFIFEFFETPEQRWSDKVVISIMGDRIREYDLHENEEVEIGFGHKVTEWQGRYYNDVTLYHFAKVKDKKEQSEAVVEKKAETATKEEEKKDDLPF